MAEKYWMSYEETVLVITYHVSMNKLHQINVFYVPKDFAKAPLTA